MVAFAPERSSRLASCWRVVVRKGAYGERRYGFDSTDRTVKAESASAAASARAFASSRCRVWAKQALSCPSGPKSRPWAIRRPSTALRRAVRFEGSEA
ncbi:hypothetical protein SBADM41S_00938 [Streptomyces badius]